MDRRHWGADKGPSSLLSEGSLSIDFHKCCASVEMNEGQSLMVAIAQTLLKKNCVCLVVSPAEDSA